MSTQTVAVETLPWALSHADREVLISSLRGSHPRDHAIGTSLGCRHCKLFRELLTLERWQPQDRTLEAVEREVILNALVRHGGRRLPTARELGIGERTLFDKLTRYAQAGCREAGVYLRRPPAPPQPVDTSVEDPLAYAGVTEDVNPYNKP